MCNFQLKALTFADSYSTARVKVGLGKVPEKGIPNPPSFWSCALRSEIFNRNENMNVISRMFHGYTFCIYVYFYVIYCSMYQ